MRKEEADAKGSKADTEGNKDTGGFQFKVFTLCYLTSFDEVRCLVSAGTCFEAQQAVSWDLASADCQDSSLFSMD